MLRFLSKHKTALIKVRFGNNSLGRGSWETVFVEMRVNLNLERCYLGRRFRVGSYVEIDRRLWNQGLPRRAIEDFILGRTQENPFDWIRATDCD